MNTFYHSPDDVIEINGEKFDLDLFLQVEPEYSLPEGFHSRLYDQNRHILYSSKKQIAGDTPWVDGERYLGRAGDLNLVKQVQKEEEDYINSLAIPKSKPSRESEYPSIHDLVIAMWEHFVENKPAEETINIVQDKRLKVKEKYPK